MQSRKVPSVLVVPVLAVLLLLVPAAETSAIQDHEVFVGGFSVARKNPDSEYGQSYAMGTQTGVSISVVARFKDRFVIGIDRKDEGEFDIKDSTGKKLEDSGSSIDFMSDISESGDTIVVPVGSEEIPAAGAESVSVSGVIMLTCGVDPVTRDFEVNIEQGKEISFGGVDFKVNSVGDSFMNDEGESVELETKTSCDHFQSITAVMEDGSEKEFKSTGGSSFGFNGNYTYNRSYEFEGKMKDIRKLRVKYFQKTEDVEFKFDVKFGLGLE